jgi:prophage regulatory protein
MTKKLIRLPKVEDMTGLCRSAIYDQMDRGIFPRPLRISARAVAWRESDVLEWMNSLKSA